MSYIATDNIAVFPSVNRGKNEARNLSEKNIVGLINKLLDNNGTFVISNNVSTRNGDTFEFMIGGYYFCIDPGSDASVSSLFSTLASTQGDTDLYAGIELVTNGSDPAYLELYGADDSSSPSKYEGVEFDTSPISGKTCLLLAQRTGDTWNIPLSSLQKYDGGRVEGIIDGNNP
ncbi:MAG: hypothetical protein J6S67_00615 [Methanobrevibacter sp.]|nr:hypothetical protein [Methanobrevibacter sp.]